ncbi:MAG: hypothetical protein AAF737_09750 [Pseudomonadota bacterium]
MNRVANQLLGDCAAIIGRRWRGLVSAGAFRIASAKTNAGHAQHQNSSEGDQPSKVPVLSTAVIVGVHGQLLIGILGVGVKHVVFSFFEVSTHASFRAAGAQIRRGFATFIASSFVVVIFAQ